MDVEFVKYLLSLGVGGVIAAGIFTVYRKDIRQYTDLWKMATDQLLAVVKDNTASNVKLVQLIETSERNQLRKEDIEVLIDRKLNNKVRVKDAI